jgi:hypothetical protein
MLDFLLSNSKSPNSLKQGFGASYLALQSEKCGYAPNVSKK